MVNTILKEADLFCPNSVRINFTIYHIGNDSLNYYNLFLQTSRATVQDLLTNNRFEHGYLLLNWLIGRFTANPQWLYICIGTFYVNSINLVGI
ncbi:hypothetical protein DW673_15840 [Lactiplantibacillus plantarum]|uniref:EpsG family protein n=1 Tax=Lactiplantibacillus plantarum TaxID=1590 RepID=UPI000E555034|nr:hypothetical protein DW673_15840 [Lactiplantibacillus plantarum]